MNNCTNVTYHDECDLDMSDENNNDDDDKNANEDTENDDEVDEDEATSDIGKQYLVIRQENIEERQQLLKKCFQKKKLLTFQSQETKSLKLILCQKRSVKIKTSAIRNKREISMHATGVNIFLWGGGGSTWWAIILNILKLLSSIKWKII